MVGLVVMSPAVVTQSDLVLGAFAGAAGFAGLVLLYSALASGSMSVVAPIVGALGAAIPVAWDVATGTYVEPLHWVGIGLSISAVLLLAIHAGTQPGAKPPFLKAVGAAVAFATFFIIMSYTDEASALWPLAAARSVTVPVAFIAAAFVGVSSVPRRDILPLVVFTGLADMAANVAILIAIQRGPLGINAVLSSLYPAFTVLAALIVLKERPSVPQRFGISLAVAAALLLAV